MAKKTAKKATRKKATRKTPVRRKSIRAGDVFPTEVTELHFDSYKSPRGNDTVNAGEEDKYRLYCLLAKHLDANCTTLEEYAATGESNHTFNGYPLVVKMRNAPRDRGGAVEQHGWMTFCVIINNIIYTVDGEAVCTGRDHYAMRNEGDRPVDVYIEAQNDGADGSYAPAAVITSNRELILNGDEREEAEPYQNLNESRGGNNLSKIPTVSFIAMGMLAGHIDDPDEDVGGSGDNHRIHCAALELANGTITLIDFIPDETIEENRKPVLDEYQRVKSKNTKPRGEDQTPREKFFSELKPPQPGFSLMPHGGLKWHRPATCIFSFKKVKGSRKKQFWLIGMDEGSYFGVELPSSVSSVNEAYDVLIPKSLRGKGGLLRQGEWFAAPVDEASVPEITNCIVFSEFESVVSLPVGDTRSNRHSVEIPGCDHNSWAGSGDGGEWRVGKNGTFYARGFSVRHRESPESENDPGAETGEHQTLEPSNSNQWYTFHENTAVRAVSLGNGGVD